MFNPDKITYFGETDARNRRVAFGIKAKDRTRHVYVIGKTGMGKSTALENMAVQDIQSGEGMAFIDPHGKTAELLLEYVPQDRIKDIVYFAPGSTVAGTRDGTFDYPFDTFQAAIDSFGTPTTQADYNRFCTIRCLNAPVISETITFSTRRYIIQLNGGTFTGNWVMGIDNALRFGSSFNPQLDIFSGTRPIGTQIIGSFLAQLTGTAVTNCTFRMTNILFTGNFTIADGTNFGSSVTTGTSTALIMVGSTITGTFLGRNTGVALFDNSSIVGNVEWQALLGCNTGSLFGSTVSQYGTSTSTRTITALALFNTITCCLLYTSDAADE